jgi:hypothetical protein
MSPSSPVADLGYIAALCMGMLAVWVFVEQKGAAV